MGFIIYYYLMGSLTRQLDTSLSHQAESIYRFVTVRKADLTDFQPDSLHSSPSDLVYDLIFDAIALNSRNTFIQVGLNKKIIYQSENLLSDSIHFMQVPTKAQKVQLYDFKDKELSQYKMRGAFLQRKGYKIIVAFPLSHIDETLSSLLDFFMFTTPVFFLLAIGFGYFISKRSLSRIDTIIRKTNEITAQNLEEEISGGEFHDEYGRLVRTMNQMIQRIRTSIEYMNQFSMSASHELKTPLTILRGEIEIALRSNKTPEQYREILKSNFEETLRLINIVDRLFLISKIDHSQIELSKKVTDITRYLSGIIKNLEMIGRERNISLEFTSETNAFVSIDPEWMQQAFYNIIENGIKYGTPNSAVHIKCKETNSKIVISFANKGEEISPEAIPHLFDRFYRVESSRNRGTGGIGLGLSVVKAVINWHDGEIEVHSENKMIEFVVTLNKYAG
jgi:signal transduction histidine kinase